ncbi:MAG TPA: response regulator [Gemmatimonadota bacterium]|nr:response regulator [Gemmatimonadota bacterium]
MSASSGRVQPIEILLVEDNPGDVRLTREALGEAKVHNRLSVAATGREALEHLGLTPQTTDEGARPDLVLLDLNLPDMSGHDVLIRIKEAPELQEIPVVILTSSEAEEDVARSYREHANAYVTKPVDLDGLARIVRSIDGFWFSVVRLPKR